MVKATLTEDWYHEPGGHIKKELVHIEGQRAEIAQPLIKEIRENKSFNKFMLTPKYKMHGGTPIPWIDKKTRKTFWGRKHYFEAICGAEVGFGVGNSTYQYTVRIQEL